MSIPQSMIAKGYLTLQQIAGRLCIMIGTEGEANTGKSEFIFSCPGPVAMLALDRNIDGVAHNSNPPRSRREDIGVKMVLTKGSLGVKDPEQARAMRPEHLADWRAYTADYDDILANPEVATVGLDGDSDSWELQRLAEFGTLSQIPSIMYDAINASRRRMIRKAYDSGKNIVATNKITDIYQDVIGPDGKPVMGNSGKAKQEKSGNKRRQGFPDHSYLYQIQIRHLLQEATWNETLKRKLPPKFGLRILECKPAMHLKGEELWGEDACFAGLVSLVYPNIPLEDWGL